MAKALVGCCGWSYGDMAEKGAGLEHSTQGQDEKTSLLFQVL